MNDTPDGKPAPHIAIAPLGRRVTVTFAGTTIVDTAAALVLTEGSYPPVYYVPRADARIDLLERTATRTHCPYKGDASYFTIRAGGRVSADAVWSYETPFRAMLPIREHLAFYPRRVDAITVEDGS